MVSTFCVLDYDTVVGADKFGNVFVLRLPAETSDDVDNPTGRSIEHLTSIMHFNVSRSNRIYPSPPLPRTRCPTVV